jgi:hypothetical protein
MSYCDSKNEMGVGACGKYRIEQKCKQEVGGENLT